jgi:hypothetical protein
LENPWSIKFLTGENMKVTCEIAGLLHIFRTLLYGFCFILQSEKMSDSVLEGDVAEVVFKKAIENVPGMYLKQMILIC